MFRIDTKTEKEKIAIVALYYASLKSSDPEYKKRESDFFILEEAYGVKSSTIKNWKDAFDAKFEDNGRQGWHDKELDKRDKILANVYEEIIESQKYSTQDIKEMVKAIIKEVSVGLVNESTVKIFLFDKDGEVQYGLNWGDRVDSSTGKERDKNEAYLQLTPDVYKTDFFPPKGIYFIVNTDDNEELIFNRAQKEEGTALQTPENNTIIGLYLRRRLGLTKDSKITKESIEDYGRDYILIRKISNKHYFLDFSNKGGAELLNLPHNRIIFGAPGTGKSFYLNKQRELNFAEDAYERVTFHPNYSYAQFVGSYKPISIQENIDGKLTNEIQYKYVPGPFLRVLVQALINPQKNYLLLIEEINRANVAAIFGDVFQLLDREQDGASTYPIAISEDMRQFFTSKGINISNLFLPQNLYIWATMNSADQGVLPMDAAFKRRWDFEYIGINEHENWDYEIPYPKNDTIELINWNTLRRAINSKLKKISGVNEDKLLGPYFISKSVLDKFTKDKTPSDDDKTHFINIFKSKVLMYLFEDVCKMRPTDLFTNIDELEEDQNRPHYSDICSNFDKKGIDIFGFDKEKIEAKYKSENTTSEAISEQA